jgi:hypothetical protein
MIPLAPRLLQDLTHLRGYHGVGCEDQGGFALGLVVDGDGVDIAGLLLSGGEDVLEGPEVFVLVFREGAGDDFEVGEADLLPWRLLLAAQRGADAGDGQAATYLCEERSPAGRLGGEDDALASDDV